jgi:DNA mismatch endonuclease (patch repair protein)
MPDRMTPAQRSYCMSRIRAFDTTVEVALRTRLWQAGIRYRLHDHKLPGRPDLVFRKEALIVFIDGDFWHGYRFPQWKARLGPYWQAKIERNRCRDRLNRRRLQRLGWEVMRIWEHELLLDLDGCTRRLLDRLAGRRPSASRGSPARASRTDVRP